MMDIKQNPRPRHRMTRCCGNCSFFLNKRINDRYGSCALPEGPKISKYPFGDLKLRIEEFTPTYMLCVCDNHVWRPRSFYRKAARYARVRLDGM